MLNNNMFSTGFNGGFGTGGWKGNEVKAPTKQEKFPGLNAQQIANIEEYTKDLKGSEKKQAEQKLYQAMIQKIQSDNYSDQRQAVENQRHLNSLNATDPRQRCFEQSGNYQSCLVDLVKDKRNLEYKTDEDTVMRMFMEEMALKGIDMDTLDNYLDHGDPELLYQAGLEERPVEKEKKGKKIATRIGEGLGVLAAADLGLYAAGKTAEKIGEKVYELPIDPSMQEARKINQAGTKVMDAEADVKAAKKDLTAAKRSGEGIEEAEKALETAEKDLAKAKGKKVVTVADTAREYNVGGGILEGWTAESRGIQASSKANQIFKKTIEPALEKSTAKIDVQKLIEGLAEDIKEIAKKDPDKLDAYNDALKDLKKSYKAKEFANYSMKDAQTLKSGLQGRTPQKFYKGKEITNELQELKGILGSKLSKEIHTNLSNEIGENSAKLYKDYANLKEYAGNMVKQSTNAGLKAGFGNFWSTAYHSLTDGASAKVGLLLNKGGQGAAKATGVEKVADSIGDAWNYLVKNGKKFLKATKGKGLKVEDPVGMVQLLKLAPGTIGEVANEFGDANPAVVADDLLFEVQNFKDTWNSMTDEERIQNIKDQYKQAYGREMDDKSANSTYEKRKEKHPDGKYGFLDPVNDVEIVQRA